MRTELGLWPDHCVKTFPGLCATSGLIALAAAKHLGISRKTLDERGAITAEMALRLETAFKPTADQWLASQAACDLLHARQHSKKYTLRPVS